MKTQSTAVASVLCTLFAGFAVAETGKETIEATEGDVTFTVDRYDDGRDKPYRVRWRDEDDFLSAFRFNTDGLVTRIDGDGDDYRIEYTSNGQLEEVTRTTSRRILAEEDAAEVIDGNDSIHAPVRRRLYDCNDCKDTMHTLLDYGVPSVCNLVGYGDPILDPAATSIQVFCETFGLLDAYESCEGQCDKCLAPLTIALTWPDDTQLDLLVVEPVGGDRVSYANLVGTFGYLEEDIFYGSNGRPEQYKMYGGLTSSSSITYYDWLDTYWVVVDSYSGEYVPFTLTATTGSGNVILEVEDEFDPDCELSLFYRVSLNEYVDNDCYIPDLDAIAAASTVEGDESRRGN